MSLLGDMRSLYRQLQQDPAAETELRQLRRMAISTFAMVMATTVAQMLQIYPIKLFFDGWGHRSHLYLAGLAGSMVVIYSLVTALDRQMEVRRISFFWRMWSFWWGYGNHRQLALSVGWHVAHSTGEKESLINKNVRRVQWLVDEFLFVTLPMFIQVLFTCLIVSLIDWRFGLLAGLTLVVYGLIVTRNERFHVTQRQEFQEQMKHLERRGTELTNNWQVIKQFGLEQSLARQNWDELQQFAVAEDGRVDAFLRRQIYQQLSVNLSRGGLYWLIGLFLSGSGLGTAVLVSNWMEQVYASQYRFGDFQRRLNEGQEALRELVQTLQLVPEVRQPEQPQWPQAVQGKVEFDRVSFSYPGGKEDALSEINLTIEPNQTVALVGYSGSGKSTVARLLLREYDPTSGVVRIDDLDLRQLDYDRYRQELVAVVSQDVRVFDTTIRQNIRMVAPHAPVGAEEQAARSAYADQFIRLLPQGYDTPIGENGVRLSGGQKQRLAIARALLRQPRILILDEATSALDARSQKEIQETIDQLIAARMCTIFVIAHRFSTIMSADTVVVLQEGRISEIGTHEELSQGQGIYHELRNLEMQGVLAEGE